MKNEIQNRASVENTTTNFNTKENNWTTAIAKSTADYSTTNININTRAIGQHQTSIIRNSLNEQLETCNSPQRDNLNSF